MSAGVVLITGAAGGIGGAVARRFAAGGWQVAASDLAGTTLDDLVAELGPPAFAVPGDLRFATDCARIVGDVVTRARRLDALVNAAGVWTEGPAEETTEEEWDLVLDVNLKGLYFVTAAAIPVLSSPGGSVISMSSDAGIQGNNGAAVYCASKGGVTNLTRALALELAPRGIRVNAVCPGDVQTPMLQGQADTFGGGNPQGYLDALLALYPQGPEHSRFTQPNEVAELIWYLAQPLAAPITGANISIDFGLSAGV